jgi:hypothetical protein
VFQEERKGIKNMENNVALTLREVADQVNKEAEEKKMAIHQEFVETKVLPYLKEMASKGKYTTDFTVPGYSISIVRDLLRSLGFTVETLKYGGGHYLIVKW